MMSHSAHPRVIYFLHLKIGDSIPEEISISDYLEMIRLLKSS